MASVALPDNPLATLAPQVDDAIGSDLFSTKPLAAAAPEPIPPFVFPARDPTPDMASQPGSGLASRRSSRNSTAPALPAFSFNPGAAATRPDPSPSPTKSTHSDASHHSRGTAGHRRRGSEFVVHDDNVASGGLASSSPPKMDRSLPIPPPVSSLGPPAGRRGHSHRRSGAISGSDMSSLIKASAMAKHGPGSAPSTPSDVNKQHFLSGETSNPPVSQSLPALNNICTPPASPGRRESAPSSVPRPRVVFREDIEFIPRPLSMISSETSSSKSTVRGSHSLNGSVVSICASPPQSKPSPSVTSPVDDRSPQVRPKTADAASPSSAEGRITDASSTPPKLLQRPASSHASPNPFSNFTTANGSPMKRKHFWSSEPTSNDISPKTTPEIEESDPTEQALPAFAPSASTSMTRPRTSPERKSSTKQRKVRTWAGSILTRKGKHRASKVKGRRTPTPPLITRQLDDSIFDNDDTVVLCNAPSPVLTRQRASEATLQPRPISWEPTYQKDEHDTDSPQIDLDAAMDCSDASTSSPVKSGFAGARARLHSGGGRGSFDSQGNYHRRTESAPELAPLDRPKLGIHRLGSNSSMGEVFDEEEEDDYLAGRTPHSKDETTSSEVESPASQEEKVRVIVDRQGSGPKSTLEAFTEQPSSEPAAEALTRSSPVQPRDEVEIVEGEDDFVGPGARSSDSTITPPLLQDPDTKRPASSPVDFAYPARPIGYASSDDTRPSFPSSTVSSPDADHISFDPQARLHPHSSDPAYAGSLRPSVDDIPSLTSSASTMTNAVPRFSSSAGTRTSADQRSASFSVPISVNPNRAKRASLASLSKLISGSSGEKSKLRYEQSAPSENGEEPTKKKGHRISRLLQFWKTKEKDGN